MSHLAGDLHWYEAFRDVVCPEDVENFEHDHHEGHQVARVSHHFELESIEAGQALEEWVQGRSDADVVEQDDPAPDPCDEAVDVDEIQDLLGHVAIVAVHPGQDEGEIAVIVEDEDGEADPPIVGQVAEENEKHGETVMQGVFEEISFWPDEDVSEETAEVLAELQNVKDLHLERCLP